jgi:lysozyme
MKYNKLIGTVLLGAVALTGSFEGKKNEPYKDIGGTLTACYGETSGIKRNDKFTDEQCAQMLAKSLSKHNAPFEQLGYQLPANVHIAALDFSYNLGVNALSRSTLYRKLKERDTKAACLEFNKWVYAAGKDCRVKSNGCYGIVTRREIETQLCMGQITVKDALIKLGSTLSDAEVVSGL